MPRFFNSVTGYSANQRKYALAGVRIQREQGFANLWWMREIFLENCRQRRRLGLLCPKWGRYLIRRGVWVGGDFTELSLQAGLKPPPVDEYSVDDETAARTLTTIFGKRLVESEISVPQPTPKSSPQVRKSRPRPQYSPARWLPKLQGPPR